MCCERCRETKLWPVSSFKERTRDQRGSREADTLLLYSITRWDGLCLSPNLSKTDWKFSQGSERGRDCWGHEWLGGKKTFEISYRKVGGLVAQLCPTLCDPMDCRLPGSSVHGIFQAKILKWVAISFSRGSSWPRDGTYVSCIDRWVLYHWATREAWKIYRD